MMMKIDIGHPLLNKWNEGVLPWTRRLTRKLLKKYFESIYVAKRRMSQLMK
jgi:hypothetical protein